MRRVVLSALAGLAAIGPGDLRAGERRAVTFERDI
jgi:hypothetical protein